jgi:Tol biopolymer transport system component
MAAVNLMYERMPLLARIAAVPTLAVLLVAASPAASPQVPPTASPATPTTPLAYMSIGRLVLGDHVGADPISIARSIGAFHGWSSSGRYLAVVHGDPRHPSAQMSEDIITPDGSVVGRIAQGNIRTAAWSPTLDQLVIAANPMPPGSSRPAPALAIYAPDGSLVRTLPTPEGVSRLTQDVSWDPDGTQFVIGGCVGCASLSDPDDNPSSLDDQWDLWVVQADGSGSARITSTWYEVEVAPSWSPDGPAIEFTLACAPVDDLPCTDGDSGIWLVAADGSDRHWIVEDGTAPVWSPDGSRIAFSAGDVTASSLMGVSSDGKDQQLITTESNRLLTPLLWGDQDEIMYSSAIPGAGVTAQTNLVEADGSDAHRLGTGWSSPAWSPH